MASDTLRYLALAGVLIVAQLYEKERCTLVVPPNVKNVLSFYSGWILAPKSQARKDATCRFWVFSSGRQK